MHQPYPPTSGDATDEMLFAELLAGVEQSYAEIESVFESNRMTQTESSASDAQVRSDGAGGMFLEFFANKVIPFDMHTTGAAVWQHFVYKKERMPYRFYYNKSNKVRSNLLCWHAIGYKGIVFFNMMGGLLLLACDRALTVRKTRSWRTLMWSCTQTARAATSA